MRRRGATRPGRSPGFCSPLVRSPIFMPRSSGIVENPDDRVMPTVKQMFTAFADAALKPAEEEEVQDNAAAQSLLQRIGASMLWKDTKATGRRFLISVALLFPAVLLGLHMAMFPYIGAFFLRFFQFFDKIVALSLLPILFIAFGIDELSKIMLIVIGVARPSFSIHLISVRAFHTNRS